ncbi:MAG: caspase family protein, partial [Thermoguttaceae bacterium]|nr:caspase family protein [Thermoguttaceae bacterium]
YDGAGGMKSLEGCANDALKLKAWFDAAYGEKGAATVLGDDASLTATATPNRDNILNALKEKAAKECDRLIVTFAGHGVHYGGKSFFCPIDVKGAKFDEVDAENRGAVLDKGAENNLIAVETVLNELKNAKAKEVVVIFDACRSVDGSDEGSFMREFADLLQRGDKAFQRENGGFFVLTSCSTGEKAKEITVGGKKYGAFTYYFVEGLGGRADFAESCDGYVTLNEAYNYAQRKVRDRQSPELFMATAQMANLPSMTRVTLDAFASGGLKAKEVDRMNDAEFLLRSGYALSKPSYPENVLRLGERALSVAAERAPNSDLTWELRGSVRRALGDFQGALNDLEQADMKLQVYVKSRRPANEKEKDPTDGIRPPLYENEWRKVALVNDAGEKTGAEAETYDLLTVEKILKNGDGVEMFWITEKNNVPLGEQAGWASREDLVWDFSIAENIVHASKLQNAPRHDGKAIASGNMIGASYSEDPTLMRPGPGPVSPRF